MRRAYYFLRFMWITVRCCWLHWIWRWKPKEWWKLAHDKMYAEGRIKEGKDAD